MVETLTVRVGCEFQHALEAAVPAIFLVRPAGALDTSILRESWTASPAGPYHDYSDLYGNVCRRVLLPAGYSIVAYEAVVVTNGAVDPADANAAQARVEELPDDVLVYTLPSRYCLSDAVADLAWQQFGGTQPGWERAQAICDYVHARIRFAYGSSTPATTSSDVLAASTGVCRDYAHVMIALARAMNIPARYVFGYLPDIDVPPPDLPMDFCAWVELFLGGSWWTFDPRNNQRRRGRVVIARGRDALDVAMLTTYGRADLKSMTVTADRIGE